MPTNWSDAEHILSDLFRFACQKRFSIVLVHGIGHFAQPRAVQVFTMPPGHELPVDIEFTAR